VFTVEPHRRREPWRQAGSRSAGSRWRRGAAVARVRRDIAALKAVRDGGGRFDLGRAVGSMVHPTGAEWLTLAGGRPRSAERPLHGGRGAARRGGGEDLAKTRP